ncbi:hypothetical protein [Meiothermus cerbereus]|uniref:hypothetical protein n=1 Tax=Meiothermus cerbereus TaxID=65552 RepID=UPI003EEF99F7
MQLSSDYKEFLKLLNEHEVEYLLVGGYAVGYHGYPRYTGDIDFWIAVSPTNAERMVKVMRAFGFDSPELTPDFFLNEKLILRMGVEPYRLEVTTRIDGVEFSDCYARKVITEIDGVQVNLISLDDLKRNKQASGRLKDLADLENLP